MAGFPRILKNPCASKENRFPKLNLPTVYQRNRRAKLAVNTQTPVHGRFCHRTGVFITCLGQFTRNYTQTVKRAADNKRRYAPGWVHSTCLLRGFPKGAAPHLAHDFAEQSVVCYTLCRRCPENTVAAGEGKGI